MDTRAYITRDLTIEQPPGSLTDRDLLNLFGGGDASRYSRQRQYRQVPLANGQFATESTETVTIDGTVGRTLSPPANHVRRRSGRLVQIIDGALGCLTLAVGIIALPVLGYWLSGSRAAGGFFGLALWALWALGSLFRR